MIDERSKLQGEASHEASSLSSPDASGEYPPQENIPPRGNVLPLGAHHNKLPADSSIATSNDPNAPLPLADLHGMMVEVSKDLTTVSNALGPTPKQRLVPSRPDLQVKPAAL